MRTVTLLVLSLNEYEGIKALMPTIDKTLFHQILFLMVDQLMEQ